MKSKRMIIYDLLLLRRMTRWLPFRIRSDSERKTMTEPISQQENGKFKGRSAEGIPSIFLAFPQRSAPLALALFRLCFCLRQRLQILPFAFDSAFAWLASVLRSVLWRINSIPRLVYIPKNLGFYFSPGTHAKQCFILLISIPVLLCGVAAFGYINKISSILLPITFKFLLLLFSQRCEYVFLGIILKKRENRFGCIDIILYIEHILWMGNGMSIP